MAGKRRQAPDSKGEALRSGGCLHPEPARVRDPLFERRSGGGFFDARDLVQVKYEMLRRVQVDGEAISKAAGDFGLSRPTFYQAQSSFAEHGLVGLLPKKPGPRGAHKLDEEVVAFLHSVLEQEPTLSSAELAERVHSHFHRTVHPRSVERALERRKKKRR